MAFYVAARPITIGNHLYAAGDTIDTTGWNPNTLSEMIRLGWIAVEVTDGSVTNRAAALAVIFGS